MGNTGTTTTMATHEDEAEARTTLKVAVEVGGTVLEVSSSDNFKKGRSIVIGKGAEQEVNKISDFGSIILATPLEKAHAAGTVVVMPKVSATVKDLQQSSFTTVTVVAASGLS